jgi:thioesterase domain-containing protein
VDRADLERYLHEHIPLSLAMGVTVRSATTESVVLDAPLAPNINHRETVFGGSASALAILAAWSLVRVKLAAAGIDCRIVIQRNCVDYDAPAAGEFSAASALEDPASWDRFVRTLARHGKGRIRVRATIESGGCACGRFEGSFVAIDTARQRPGGAPRPDSQTT